MSLILGRGYAYATVHSFSFLKSITARHLALPEESAFLRSKSNGLLKALLEGAIIPSSRSLQICQFFYGATAPSGPGSPHQGFTITLRHTTLGRTPLGEGPARRKDLYLTTLTRDRQPCPRRNSNPQCQQANGRGPTP